MQTALEVWVEYKMAGNGKRKYNAEQSRLDILRAAEEHFALRGFYGARVNDVADTAAINKRMIYEYFGDKEQLYEAVLQTVYKRMADAEEAVMKQNFHGVRLVEEVVSMYFDFLQANPGFVSILLWENLNQAQNIKHMTGQSIARPTSEMLREELRKGQMEGLFRSNLDVDQTVISLITMSFANFSNRFTLSEMFEVDLTSEASVKLRKQHTIDIILAYICADGSCEAERKYK